MEFLEKYDDRDCECIFPEGKLFRITYNSKLDRFKITTPDTFTFECLREAFSFENSSAFFVRMHGYNVEGKNYLVNSFGYFKTGLIFKILAHIRDNYGDLGCVAMSKKCAAYVSDRLTPLKSLVGKLDRESFEIRNISVDRESDGVKKMELRDYQENAIRSIIFDGYGRGLIELPTAGGKSFVLSNLIWTVETSIKSGLRYLIYVPNRQLVDQFYKDMLSYGFRKDELTRLTSGLKKAERFNPEARIIIANRQYLFSNSELLPKIDVLLNDEVHQGKPNSSTMAFVDGLDCAMKIGCSGTIPRDPYERLSLVGSFGKVLYVENITSLQRKGFISKLKIHLVKIRDRKVAANRQLLFHENSSVRFDQTDPNGIKFSDAYNAEIEYTNANYAVLYRPILEKIGGMEGNTLLLFDRIEFGKNMFELSKEFGIGKKVYYIDGQTPVAEREENRARMEKENDNILLGQCSILSTGINIKNLTNLVIMVSTKSFTRVLQSIGRTLRLHDGKDFAHIYDVSFNFKYSHKHLRERLNIYGKMYGKKPDTTETVEVN
jgi:DNA or RNA helicases of superfamily II